MREQSAISATVKRVHLTFELSTKSSARSPLKVEGLGPTVLKPSDGSDKCRCLSEAGSMRQSAEVRRAQA